VTDWLRQLPPEDMRVLLFWLLLLNPLLLLILVVDVGKWATERQKLRRQAEQVELTRDLLRVSQLTNDDTRRQADKLARKAEQVTAAAVEVKTAIATVAPDPRAP
jgi:hypothetical protein